MDGLNLRKLFSKKKTAGLLRGLVEEQSKKSPIAILDADKVLIIGEVPSTTEQAPIMADGELIGWISGTPTPSLALLIAHLFLSEQEKSVLLKEALDKYRELHLLYGLSEKLDACPDCAEISRLILNEALRTMAPDSAEVLLLNADKLEMSADFGTLSQQYVMLGSGLVRKVFEKGRAELLCLEIPGGEVYAAMGAPLKAKDQVIGVFWMERQSSEPYTAKDLNFLNTIALQAASAIDRKLVEARLIDARLAAEAADRAKSQFLANMSHEIRTPMNGILGMTELVLETEMTSEQKDGLEVVRESANNLLNIIEAVLDLSSLEGHRLKLKPGEFSLSRSLCRITDLLAVGAHRKGLTFCLDLQLGIPDPLVGDAGCLRQIVVNLVENAIKFTENGEISLSVRVESQSSKQVVLGFRVSDTGCGIAPEKLTAIFEPFVQSDSSFSRKHGGMGLGLSIAKQLAEMMAGSITAESSPEQGSTFHLKLPFGINALPASSLPSIEMPGRSNRKRPLAILLVEDNLVNQKMASRLLEKQGHRVIVANNGEEALRHWNDESFDLILMDIQMPVMDGLEATLAIRRREKERGGMTPIIAVTAHALKSDREQCLSVGMDSYVVKPIQREVLLAEIERVLSAFSK